MVSKFSNSSWSAVALGLVISIASFVAGWISLFSVTDGPPHQSSQNWLASLLAYVSFWPGFILNVRLDGPMPPLMISLFTSLSYGVGSYYLRIKFLRSREIIHV